MTTTKMTARSVNENQRIASGNHAIGGSACSPVITVPAERCTKRDAAIAIPISVPTTIENASASASRHTLPIAAASSPFSPVGLGVRAVHTEAGEGSVEESTTAAAVAHTMRMTAAATTLGQICSPSRFARSALHLLGQVLVDVEDDVRHEDVLEAPRTRRRD